MAEPRKDIAGIVFTVGAIGVLTVTSLWTLRPFIGAAVWATMLVVATWPVLIKLQGWFGGRRTLAVTVMSVTSLLVLVLPLLFAVLALAQNADKITAWVETASANALPAAPGWLASIPLVGEKLVGAWNDMATSGPGGLSAAVRPYMSDVLHWLVGQLGNVGGALVQFLLTVGIATIMYAKGESTVAGVNAFAHRLAGERGPKMVRLAGMSIRSVALGVVGTAAIQATLGAVGLVVTGVPYAAALSLVMFICCVAQLGPLLVLLPCTYYVYTTGSTGWAIALLIWSLVLGTVDNFLRPYLIKKGADLPLLLILCGVIGGLLSFGLLGIFIGPVVLAVTFSLLEEWVSEAKA